MSGRANKTSTASSTGRGTPRTHRRTGLAPPCPPPTSTTQSLTTATPRGESGVAAALGKGKRRVPSSRSRLSSQHPASTALAVPSSLPHLRCAHRPSGSCPRNGRWGHVHACLPRPPGVSLWLLRVSPCVCVCVCACVCVCVCTCMHTYMLQTHK